MMYKEILMYATTGHISDLINWAMALLIGMLTLRAVNDFMNAFADPETGFREAMKKTGNRIKAVVIAITIEGTVLWIKKFFVE